MATNPYFTQLHTQRFSFIGSPQQRDGTATKDQRFLNMYPELIKSPISDGKKYYLKKRPGMDQLFSLTPGQGQGIYFWPATGGLYTAIGGVLYFNSVPLLGLSQASTPVGFTEFRSESLDVLFVCDGNAAWLISTGNTVTNVGTVPAPHLPNPVFLDGYIFLAALGSQTIHNSALQDPTTWPSDGFIDAEMYPDNIVALTKAQNYVVAVGGQSIEFFYDNANATGSPLQRNAPAVAQFGCPANLTVNQTEKETIMVGTTNAGGRTVWVIDGFQPTEIANEPVREALDLEGGAMFQARAMTVQCSGHKWYILNLFSSQRTFVYDFDEQMWHEWTSGPGQTAFQWSFATDGLTGLPSFVGTTNGIIASMDAATYTELGQQINCQIITTKLDFDTIMWKRFFRLSLIGDSPNGNTSTPVIVDWSDDDYNTWVGNRTLLLNGAFPTITQMGISRRRAYRFTYQQPFPLRLEAFELDVTQNVRR